MSYKKLLNPLWLKAFIELCGVKYIIPKNSNLF